MKLSTIVGAALALAACTRPGEDRALADGQVGVATSAGVTVAVTDRLAAIRTLAPGQLELWASAPVLEVTIDVPVSAAGAWRVTVANALPDADLREAGVAIGTAVAAPRPTVLVRDVALTAGRHVITVGPAPEGPGPFRIAAMADIQTGLPTVDEVFAAIATTSPRFVVCMGDLTERSGLEEYALFEAQLATLPVPFYTTLGNHELWADPARYFDRYGRATFQFVYRDVAFTFADSGDAGLDPLVEDEVDAWLARAADRTHVFLTHFPPIDPVGIRDGAFRSRRDAHRLIGKLADAGVDLALYGHIHSYAAFEHAGIPAYVSGGGGARPELWDGIGRHFLVLELEAGARPIVGVRRVD
ncbi:MAG: metallophosphoesterase [Myxococcales bacterium]|nr:metallophosphoesterase [Myxococcales bacterium]